MNPLLGPNGFRAFCGLLGIGGIALALSVVVLLASGGYETSTLAGGFDPVKVGFLVFFATGTLAFVLLTVAGVVARRSEAQRVPLANISLFGGVAVLAATLLAVSAWLPASPGPLIRIGLVIGFGLVVAGMVAPRRHERG